MPTEEFLARLVRSRTPGASVMVVGVPEERGPEADSKSALPVSGVAGGGDSETTIALVKDKERKRHRDGGSSRSHHSKKFKEPVVPSGPDELASSAKTGMESRGRAPLGVVNPDGSSKGGLLLCKNYVDKLSIELERLLKLSEVVDVGEVSKLRGEVRDLEATKANLEKSLESLTHENTASADRIFQLLSEKSELITECDSLGSNVKGLTAEVCGLKAALAASREELVVKENSWTADRGDLVAKLDDTRAELAHCNAESLKSFEEGYGECLSRLSGAGVDVVEHGFESYLADLQNKNEVGGTGSSEHPDKI